MAWLQRRANSLPPFYVLGDPAVLHARAAALSFDVPLREVGPEDAAGTFDSALPVAPLAAAMSPVPGRADASNAAGTIEAIERGVADVMGGRSAGLVTAPISKKPLYDAGFLFPGHTEFLGHLAQVHTGRPARAVMMLAGPLLRTVPLTVHIPLTAVAQSIDRGLILDTAETVLRELRSRFAIASPRLAVAGLNPHAGEGGAMGREEIEIIAPAIDALRARGHLVTGPLPADTMFHEAARRGYDAVLCMYHDQALIPVKTIGFDDTVNVTLGLPFIRTSPDHGTAYDIAGTGRARPESLIAAIRMAASMAGAAPR